MTPWGCSASEDEAMTCLEDCIAATNRLNMLQGVWRLYFCNYSPIKNVTVCTRKLVYLLKNLNVHSFSKYIFLISSLLFELYNFLTMSRCLFANAKNSFEWNQIIYKCKNVLRRGTESISTNGNIRDLKMFNKINTYCIFFLKFLF